MKAAAFALVSLAVAACSFGTAPPGPRTNGARGLAPLFAALDTEHGPVRIVQLGDSHSAGDFFSGRLRELFQERFGAAGRGLLPPGIPYPYFRPALVAVAESEGWRHANSLTGSGPFGVTGSIAQSAEAGASMDLRDTEPAGFDRGFFEVLRQPGAGAVRWQVDSGPAHELDTAAARVAPQWVAFEAPRGSRQLRLAAADGRAVTLLGWGSERAAPGVVYENLGVSGATVGIVGHWSDAAIAEELRRRRPAAIVVAYGTNEAVEPETALAGYGGKFERAVARLAAAAPEAAIVVVGPPDVNRRGAGECGGWTVPPGLALVRRAQREAAARHGWYFWDWQQAMGGDCAIDRWAGRDPPLAAADHVHLTAAGYRHSAELLFAVLMDAYRRYHATRLAGS
jgi:lysophospholipase L1-like esterase